MSHGGGRAARFLSIAALQLLAAGGTQAQVPSSAPAAAAVQAPPLGQAAACLRSVPDSLLKVRDTIYLHALVLEAGARTLMPQADLLAQRVAVRVRGLLGAAGEAVPLSDPAVRWTDDLGGNLVVRLRRDGRATWTELLPMPLPDTAPTRLVAHALDAVLSRGEAVGWPGEVASRDSVVVRLGLDRRVEPLFLRGVGLGFPVFVVRRPSQELPARISGPVPVYPADQKTRGVVASITMAATIDTAGRPEPGSVGAVWPDTLPPLAGQDAADYDAFVKAARDALSHSLFSPGRLGGCAVRVRMTMPFNFTVAGP